MRSLHSQISEIVTRFAPPGIKRNHILPVKSGKENIAAPNASNAKAHVNDEIERIIGISHMKRIIAAALFAVLTTAAFAAGTIPLSLSQQFDTQGNPLTGCKLYTYAAGTTTPQNSYQDTGLTILNPWPLECDASGRLPQFFYADGSVKIRLADKNGITVVAADGILVIGPSAGGGSGSPVDPTTILATGDIKIRWGTGTLSGFVRGNGRTIGNAASSATERAHADTQALWEYLCSSDTTLRATISGGGYSGNCTNDYNANKTIQLPDYRGRGIAGLGDMGNTATTDLTSTYCGADPTVLGQACGTQSTTLAQANLPSVAFAVSGFVSVTTETSVSIAPGGVAGGQGSANIQAGGGALAVTSPASLSASASSSSSASHSLSAASGGSSTAFSRVLPIRLATVYIKL